MAKIHGFNKLTLLDYPGRLAATIFLGSCNFRCPFCHNAGLVLAPESEPLIETEEVLKVLRKRKGILDGVCVTGGEPTLDPGLTGLLTQIKELGYPVKLDTNGTRPALVRELVDAGLVDYVAMDIKNSQEKYAETAGIRHPDLESITRMVEYLKSGVVDYEFRTTVVKELHKREDIEAIGQWHSGSRRYFLQNYKESEQVIRPVFTSYSREQLENFQQILRKTIPQVEIRGI